jgi:integrase
MPKITKHPYLRSLPRKAASGKVTTYYYFDRRHMGLPDVALGKDFDVAIVRWAELYHDKPQVRGTVEEAFQLFEFEKLGIGVMDGKKAPPTAYPNKNTHDGYVKALRWLRPVFGGSVWEAIKLPHLKQFLKLREGKTQANRNLDAFQVIWNFARQEGLTELPWPASGMERSGWKNREKPRKARVSDAMFSAIYAEADQLLRDAMDIASATGMRVTDVYTVPLPHGDSLRLEAGKTGKEADFDLSLSAVLPELIKRRRANKKAEHLMLLAGPFKRPVTYWMLSERYTKARAAAAKKAREADDKELAEAIEGMFLRDLRKYAADKATDLEEASKLLQHSDKGTTRRHYRGEVEKIKPVR